MKSTVTDRLKALAMFVALTSMALLPGTSRGQSHDTFTDAWLSGPDGNSTFPRAHVGETVNVHVVVWNLDTYRDSITINRVSLVIHHGTGDVVIPNLTPDAVVVPLFRQFADITTSFVVTPSDGELLQVDFEVQGLDNWDGFPWDGSPIPLAFSAAGGMQVQILRPAVEVFQACDVSPAYPSVTISGSVTNTGNTPLYNVVVVSDNGTPGNTADDTMIPMGTLDANSSASYSEIHAPKGSSHYTVTVRATDALGLAVDHSTTSTIPVTALPDLRIARAGKATIKVSWPESAEGFRLETSEELGPGRTWTPVSDPSVASGGEFSVTLDISGPVRFYRLARQ